MTQNILSLSALNIFCINNVLIFLICVCVYILKLCNEKTGWPSHYVTRKPDPETKYPTDPTTAWNQIGNAYSKLPAVDLRCKNLWINVMAAVQKHVTLRNGVQVPVIGLGKSSLLRNSAKPKKTQIAQIAGGLTGISSSMRKGPATTVGTTTRRWCTPLGSAATAWSTPPRGTARSPSWRRPSRTPAWTGRTCSSSPRCGQGTTDTTALFEHLRDPLKGVHLI